MFLCFSSRVLQVVFKENFLLKFFTYFLPLALRPAHNSICDALYKLQIKSIPYAIPSSLQAIIPTCRTTLPVSILRPKKRLYFKSYTEDVKLFYLHFNLYSFGKHKNGNIIAVSELDNENFLN